MEDLKKEVSMSENTTDNNSPIDKISLSADAIENHDKLNYNSEAVLQVRVKVLSKGKDVYTESDKDKPPIFDFEVLSAKVVEEGGDGTIKKIDKARNMKELEDAVENEDVTDEN